MKLYAESSAVLAWLLGESEGEVVRGFLAEADVVITSDLTLVECDRVLIRAHAMGEISEVEAADCRAALNQVSAHWNILRLHGEVVDRARRPFPREPIRTLDALHLSSALTARATVADVVILSLDGRIRSTAHALGYTVVPGYSRA